VDARSARDLGAHGALVVTPYYNKPMPHGVVAHFEALAEAAPGLPLIAYNVPGRTGSNLSPATLQELWKIPAVVALKESSGNLAQIGEIARARSRAASSSSPATTTRRSRRSRSAAAASCP
jgi:4-hydroxy-tetrahydrodipicolinate synthase